MRHVFLENPDRIDLAGVDDAYYLGPALLVAPVVARGAVTKTFDLPAGWYLDWHDQKLVQGGQVVTLDAPLEKLPLLLRDGQLVPLLDPTIDTLSEENDPAVIGPGEVGDVYDVVGLLSQSKTASFTFAEGYSLQASYDGTFSPPGLPVASDEAELSTCAGCYKVDDLAANLTRVRISVPDGDTTAGGLTLSSNAGRRIRWDLYLVK
jgi:hypothetical protein